MLFQQEQDHNEDNNGGDETGDTHNDTTTDKPAVIFHAPTKIAEIKRIFYTSTKNGCGAVVLVCRAIAD